MTTPHAHRARPTGPLATLAALVAAGLLSMACDSSDRVEKPDPQWSQERVEGAQRIGTDQDPRGERGATTRASGAATTQPSGGEAATMDGTAPTALLDASQLTETAPEQFTVRLETTKGPIVLDVHRDWAPHGADRFYNLVKNHYYDDIAVFRAIDGFMVQFGIHGDPAVNEALGEATIPPDPVVKSNVRGMVTYAMGGSPDTRTVQLFINTREDNSRLDAQGFAPFAEVVEGMDVVDQLYTGYGEGAPRGSGPSQGLIQEQGNAYLRAQFPRLDYIERARIVDEG